LPATIVGYHTKVVTFCRPRKWLFYWSNYAVFHNHGLKALYTLIQKTLEAGPKIGLVFQKLQKLRTLSVGVANNLIYLQKLFEIYTLKHAAH